jgi:hypothetical protein
MAESAAAADRPGFPNLSRLPPTMAPLLTSQVVDNTAFLHAMALRPRATHIDIT